MMTLILRIIMIAMLELNDDDNNDDDDSDDDSNDDDSRQDSSLTASCCTSPLTTQQKTVMAGRPKDTRALQVRLLPSESVLSW